MEWLEENYNGLWNELVHKKDLIENPDVVYKRWPLKYMDKSFLFILVSVMKNPRLSFEDETYWKKLFDKLYLKNYVNATTGSSNGGSSIGAFESVVKHQDNLHLIQFIVENYGAKPGIGTLDSASKNTQEISNYIKHLSKVQEQKRLNNV